MKSTKKVLIVLLCMVLATAAVLSGCGGTSQLAAGGSGAKDAAGGGTQASAVTPEEGATVTHFVLNGVDNKYLETIAADFQKVNPKIKVKFITVPYSDFDSKLQTMIASDTPPDVTSHYASQSFAGYQAKNLVLDLSPLIASDNFNPNDYGIDENLYKSFNVNGKQFAIPFRTYVSVLAYNKDLFDKAGVPYPPSDYEDKSWTWDKMVEIAKKLTVISDDPTQTQYGISFSWLDPMYILPLMGVKIFDDETWTNGGFPKECYFDSPEAVNALQRLEDLAYTDKVVIPPVAIESLVGKDGDPFLAGKIAMSFQGAWGINGVKDMPFKLGIAAIPWYKDNIAGRSTNYTDPLWVMKASKYPQASYLWIKYQLEKDVQEKVTEMSGNCPINVNAMDKYYNYFQGVDAKDMKNMVEGGIKYGINAYGNVVVFSGPLDTVLVNEWNPVVNGKAHARDIAPVLQQKAAEQLKKLNKDYGRE